MQSAAEEQPPRTYPLVPAADSTSITWAPAASANRSARPGMTGKDQDLVGLRQGGEGLGGQFGPHLVEVHQDLIDHHGQALGVLSELPHQAEPEGQVQLLTGAPAERLGLLGATRAIHDGDGPVPNGYEQPLIPPVGDVGEEILGVLHHPGSRWARSRDDSSSPVSCSSSWSMRPRSSWRPLRPLQVSSTGSKTGPALPQGCWPYSPRPSSKESRWSRIGLCEAAPGGSTLGAYQNPPAVDRQAYRERKETVRPEPVEGRAQD